MPLEYADPVTCPSCNTTLRQLLFHDLKVIRLLYGPVEEYVVVICQQCGYVVRYEANHAYCMRIICGGGIIRVVGRPAELDDSERHTQMPPFSYNNCIDFHFMLLQSTWFDELLEAIRRSLTE